MKKNYKDSFIQQALENYSATNQPSRTVIAPAYEMLANKRPRKINWSKIIAPIACCLVLVVSLIAFGVLDENMSLIGNHTSINVQLPDATKPVYATNNNVTTITMSDKYSDISITYTQSHCLVGSMQTNGEQYSNTIDKIGDHYEYHIYLTLDGINYNIFITSSRGDMMDYYIEHFSR